MHSISSGNVFSPYCVLLFLYSNQNGAISILNEVPYTFYDIQSVLPVLLSQNEYVFNVLA